MVVGGSGVEMKSVQHHVVEVNNVGVDAVIILCQNMVGGNVSERISSTRLVIRSIVQVSFFLTDIAKI